jgi:Uma2 family endonuclease
VTVALPKVRMTVAQFLDWGQAQSEGRYELVDGEVITMSPEKVLHNLVKAAICRALEDAVDRGGLDYTVFTDGIGIVIDDMTCREPDVSVQRGSTLDEDALTNAEPVIVVEVTSPSSVRTDGTYKLIEYFSLPTIMHYLVVDPRQKTVVHHRRGPGDVIETRILREGELILDPPGLAVPFSKLFGRKG